MLPFPVHMFCFMWLILSGVKVGRLNLLTPQRVKSSVAEIETGEMVRLE